MKNISIIEYNEKYAATAVKMWRLSKEKALGVKDELHSFDGHLNFVTQHLINTDQVFLAIEGETDKVVGIIAFDSEWINQLYVDVNYQNSGIGSLLLNRALKAIPGPVQLHTFEVNKNAQLFYEKHGFKVIAQGDCDNEENLPAFLYRLDIVAEACTNVTIEPINEQHLPFVQKYASNPQISKTSNVPFPYPENGAVEWYGFIKEGVKSGKCKVFAILNNSEFCGVITLNDIQIEKQSTQIDYWLAVEFHNKGITTKAVKAVMNLASETLSICNFYSGGLKKNFASCKVLEKNGFSETGTFVMSEGKFKGEEIRQFKLCKS